MRKFCLALAFGLAPLVAAAQDSPAKSGDDLAGAFGAREAVHQISLSPDGTKVAIIQPTKGRGSALMIGDLVKGGDLKAIANSTGNPDKLVDCHWSTDTRLICRILITTNVDGDRLGFSRIIAVDSDGKNLKLLSARTSDRALGLMQNGGSLIDWGAGGNGSALMTRLYVPEASTGTHIAESQAGLGVELIDTGSLSRKQIEPARESAVDYISDGQGSVRVMGIQPKTSSGYDSGKIIYSYRTADSRAWKPLTTVTIVGGQTVGFVPYAVDRALNVAYGFENQDGRTALYSIALDGSMTKKLILSRADVDIDDLIEVGRQNRVVGATFVTDRRQADFFDPTLKTLRAALGKALPGKIITFIDASADESKLLLFANSDIDPGRYYLFDKKTRSMAEVLASRPGLDGIKLATVKPITYQAADGSNIPAYLTLPAGSDGKNLPAIVMPHGGPGARDEWGFDWLSQYFAARGYAVIQPNFRGSTGYGDAWYQKNGFQSWRTSIGDVNDAGRWLVKSGIANPRKLAIVGWSYGGYAALQSSVLDPDLFKAIVAVAPVTDLDTLRDESRNFTNFPQVDALIGHGPWVDEGSPAHNAGKIKASVLLFHGDRDTNVGIGESRLMAGKIKGAGGKVELVEFKGLDHQLDDDTARTTMLGKADAFLRNAMGL
ncbi:alpha/beta hydrolase family protein [Sphingomonas asaccharolytica]|uniref:alpha/beta hydrolase family protein n=1 Tax=Sphingomonas asaccharolytica TaxID=40681 RepID=UPI0008340592|nr:S9 family peptidase [Sphingomonas asaccharolytica]